MWNSGKQELNILNLSVALISKASQTWMESYVWRLNRFEAVEKARGNVALLASPSSMSFEALAEKSSDQQIRGCLIGDDRQTNLLRAQTNKAIRRKIIL